MYIMIELDVLGGIRDIDISRYRIYGIIDFAT